MLSERTDKRDSGIDRRLNSSQLLGPRLVGEVKSHLICGRASVNISLNQVKFDTDHERFPQVAKMT